VSFLPIAIDSAAAALFLDVDGTLLEIRDRPEAVSADSSLIELLDTVSSCVGGALSLVSGRSIADIDRIFAPAKFPAAGSHGAELRLHPSDDVDITTKALPSGALARLSEFAATHEGLLLERKSGGASLHYRMAPELEAACRKLVDELMREIGQDFRLIPGKMVFELAPRGHNKGKAIAAMMNRKPFVGRRPVFVGDDVTDEDGFHAVNAMRGISVRVGEDRDSAAAYALGSVADVRHWLESITK
jgi:trehalose 6-phosphate phosphatase